MWKGSLPRIPFASLRLRENFDTSTNVRRSVCLSRQSPQMPSALKSPKCALAPPGSLRQPGHSQALRVFGEILCAAQWQYVFEMENSQRWIEPA
jgi:hypothetical protein